MAYNRLRGMQLPNHEMCSDLIIESVRYYSICCFEMRDFVKKYGRKRMAEEIRKVIRYDEMENEIHDLMYYVARNQEYKIAQDIERMIEEYRKYEELKIVTFQIRAMSVLVIVNRMIKEGYL